MREFFEKTDCSDEDSANT